MALSANMVWEVRPGAGNALNSGGFVTGATGTDYTLQNGSQVTFNGTTVTATNVGASDTITLTGVVADATWIGNTVRIASGTNFTAGVYQIIAQTGATIQFDRNCTTGAGAAMVGRMGGAVLSLLNCVTTQVAGNVVYVKGSGTDTFGQNITMVTGTVVLPTRLEGYVTTRGDIRTATFATLHTANGFLITTGWPTIAVSTFALTTNLYNTMVGLIVSSSKTSGNFVTSNNGTNIWRCRFAATGAGTQMMIGGTPNASVWYDVEFDNNGQAGNVMGTISAASLVIGCRFRSTLGGGVACNGTGVTFIDNVFYGFASGETAISASAANVSVYLVNNSFNGIAGTVFTIPDLAQTTVNAAMFGNQITNVGTVANNLRSATQLISVWGRRNRIRDASTTLTGWYDNNALLATITTAQTDANEYVSAAAGDLHLKRGASGIRAFDMRDTGAYQRPDPTLPAVGDVESGVQYGDSGTEFTGTLVLPNADQVEEGVGFGAGGTEFTGTFEGGGGNFVHIIGG